MMSDTHNTNKKRARLTPEALRQAQRDANAARFQEQLRLRASVRHAHAPEAARLATEALALVRALIALEETMQEAEPAASFCDDLHSTGSLETAERILDVVRRAALQALP